MRDTQAAVKDLSGREIGNVELPASFGTEYREDVIRRALLSEQSARYQPQGRYPLAGLQTSAVYVGRMNTYRTRRHSGTPARPRQKLAGGAMGDVRRIPSAVKGRRAHPQKVEKVIVERMNKQEHLLALRSAVAATGRAALLTGRLYNGPLPLVVSDDIEKVAKTKELIKVLGALGLGKEIDASHAPKTKTASRRKASKRHFRKSVLIVAKDAGKVGKAGRNIPGVDVADVRELNIALLAPGARPRLVLWSQAAIAGLEEALQKGGMA